MSEHPDDYPELAVLGWSDKKVLEDAYKPLEKESLEIPLVVLFSCIGMAIVAVLTLISGDPIHLW